MENIFCDENQEIETHFEIHDKDARTKQQHPGDKQLQPIEY